MFRMTLSGDAHRLILNFETLHFCNFEALKL